MHEEAMQRLSEASSRHRQFHSEIDAMRSVRCDLDRYATAFPVSSGLGGPPGSLDVDLTSKPNSTIGETLQELNNLKDNIRRLTQTLEHVRKERDELQIQLSDEKIKSAKLHNELLERQAEHSYHYLGGCPYVVFFLSSLIRS
ncbi:hypothetical protein M433DRAFT_140300 [Acidomyces richmondensis BFW]|nr:MAG: hypothetical protein FE78DRAFT_83158 [Acidomyces sp. 'richmondensis']KYG49200.1 hypothetical protein M433DRAFT_140300 [Acidomyces richmondensis BFW]